MVWGIVAVLLAGSLAALAWRRSRQPGSTIDFYGLDRETERRYSAGFAALAVGSSVVLAARPAFIYPLLAVIVLAGVFYGASFARGAVDESEE